MRNILINTSLNNAKPKQIQKNKLINKKVLIGKSIRTLFVELRRLELLTLCLQSRCATSCAIAPFGIE